jgi:hypothetical protein
MNNHITLIALESGDISEMHPIISLAFDISCEFVFENFDFIDKICLVIQKVGIICLFCHFGLPLLSGVQ